MIVYRNYVKAAAYTASHAALPVPPQKSEVGREGGSRLCEVPRGRAQVAAQLEARVEVRAVEGAALGGHLG